MSVVNDLHMSQRAVQAVGDDGVLAEVLRGLSARGKSLPCKLLYDARGSELFDEICNLPEYYPTRTESAILRDHAAAIAARVQPGAVVIELGSGSSTKTRILLDALPHLAAYVPVDISRVHLHAAAVDLRREYPRLQVVPLAADYTAGLALPPLPEHAARIVFFPGSTIGNFHPNEAVAFLRRLQSVAGAEGGLIIGVDLHKPGEILLPAYDDAQGVTAAFNRNILHRLNREWAGDFVIDRFEHLALWDAHRSRVEMHLVSVGEQRVRLAGRTFHFRDGETIRTECSYKHTLDGFSELAGAAGWRVDEVWTDERRWFSVQWLTSTGA